MSKTIGAVISEQLFKSLEEEMTSKGYLSISETIRVILRDYFKEKELENEPTQKQAAEQPARTG